MKTKILFFNLLIILLFPCYSFSSHLAGGEISYIYLGNNQYQINVKMYRDCYNGIAPFDDPAVFAVFNHSNQLVFENAVILISVDTITNSPFNCLPIAPSSICYQLGTYQFNLILPPVVGGYQLAYQRCCRLSSLTNIISPDRTGITLYATIPDSVYIENSSPVFNNLPFTLLCENVPFTFDNSATDADVDSLVYSLCTPLNGGSMSVPAPDPPSNPPYDSISWLPPYSLSNLMGGSPFTINQQTGLLSGTPNSAGVFNYGVCVSEYRNGIYLGNTMRDFQVTVFSIIGIQENSIEKFITSYTGNNSNNIIFKISPDLYINDAEIIIYNMLGKEVGCTKNINENEIIFERKSMAVGIYSFRFFNKGMLVGTSKIILN